MTTATEVNRMANAITRARAKIADLEPEQVTRLEATTAIDFEEHAAYQNAQALAHASGKIRTVEAQVIYLALGECGSADNGGWAAGTDIATKVVVTQAVGELIGARLGVR